MSHPSGKTIRTVGGYDAFVPSDLPPSISWTSEILRQLSEADRAVGRLAGEGRRLPNPHVFMRPFIRREAVLSSKIEGTQATLGELLAAEAGARLQRSPDELREVANYVVALEHGIERLKSLPVSLRLVRELHGKLMLGARGAHATPGEFRRSQNWIGPPGSTLATATYVPPPPAEMQGLLGRWETYLHDRSEPPLVQIAWAHYQFEAIHPFLDGNGRVGRLLNTLFLVEREILPTPLLYLSAFFDATRPEYYARLRGVTRDGAWEEWLVYFLTGVARQADDALGRAERINALLEEWRGVMVRSSQRAAAVVELFAENPFWSATRVAQKLGVAYTTARRAMDKLLAAGIIETSSDARRDRVYCARKLLEILEEPAQLTG